MVETIFQFIDVAESAAGQTNALPKLEGVTGIWFFFILKRACAKERLCRERDVAAFSKDCI